MSLRPSLKLLLFFISSYFLPLSAWRQWNYSIASTTSSEVWMTQWSKANGEDIKKIPRPRRGHSLVLAGDYLVMFGGRGNEAEMVHIPRTYNVEKEDGRIIFTTYEDKPVLSCQNALLGENYTYSDDANLNCTGVSLTTTVGLFYNDVWAYNLNCTRYFNGPCEGSGWELWHPGALQGGCIIALGQEVCTVPAERWRHRAVYFSDETMYVYGGFAPRCADFCDDLWMFDLNMRAWREVYAEGELSKLDGFKDSFGWGGPGKRWKFSMTNDDEIVAIFGGFRLWHGYAAENTENNNWQNFNSLPPGGYLNDLWFYTKTLDFTTTPGSTFKTTVGKWQKVLPRSVCRANPGISWESRFDTICSEVWPSERAGHGSALDLKRGKFWIFGGYRTYYPYLSTDSYGASNGSNVGSGGFVPYPQYLYFLNDMWYYDLTTGLWVEVVQPDGAPNPTSRMDMVFLLTDDVIFMHGGYADNYLYDDVWYFDLTTHKWLEKKRFVYPRYPASCTDDWEFIIENNCTALEWPLHLQRDLNYPYKVLPALQQPYHYPDSDIGPYFDIFDKGEIPEYGNYTLLRNPTQYAPMVPYAATGPLQFVKAHHWIYNYTTNVTLYERCTSVVAEPTREKIVDGLAGRSNSSVFIAVPRRQRPGWDGCRNRDDGNPLLNQELQYIKPYARADHAGVFVPQTGEILIYGGKAYLAEQPRSNRITWPYKVADDMWYYNFNHCVNNCSLHGVCKNGFCECYVGYYGVDCSNISCPGTFCYYDPDSHEQICTHACQAGYNHTDDDVYIPNLRKTPCSQELPGESNGICDGYGNTYCAPPFITEDCSVKDCKNNCSFNGYCSVEYPVSRCLCNPGYFGDSCEWQYCLNNCSYPNGICNYTDGKCGCRMMYDPYNNSRAFKPWAGEDCSFLHAYAAAPTNSLNIFVMIGLVVLSITLQQLVTEQDDTLPSNSSLQQEKDPIFVAFAPLRDVDSPHSEEEKRKDLNCIEIDVM